MQDDIDIRRRENDIAIWLCDAHEQTEALLDIMGVFSNPTLARIRAALGALASARMEGGSLVRLQVPQSKRTTTAGSFVAW
jgi:hypothetical protein